MKDLVALVKGNPDKLKGEVIVYSKLEIPNEKTDVFAVYLTSDPEKYIEKFQIPLEEAEEIREKSGIEKAVAEVIAEKSNIEIISSHVYARQIDFNEDELTKTQEDVVFTGTYCLPPMCAEALKAGQLIYSLSFFSQISREKMHELLAGKNKEPKASPSPESRVSTWSDISAEDFMSYLSQKYMLPMVEARKSSNASRFDQLKSDFLRFNQGANYFPQAETLIRLMETRTFTETYKKDLTIVSEQVRLIYGIRAERFEISLDAKRKIKFLLEQKS